MSNIESPRVAVYARVSCDRGATNEQLLSIEQRLREDKVSVDPRLRFFDEGYCGSTLERPALSSLRQAVTRGHVSCLYIVSPDRLSRSRIEQDLLESEFKCCGVDVRFLDQPPEA